MCIHLAHEQLSLPALRKSSPRPEFVHNPYEDGKQNCYNYRLVQKGGDRNVLSVSPERGKDANMCLNHVWSNLCNSISAKASGAVSPVPLCCRSWPLISLRKTDEWKGHRFHEYLQYQFLLLFIRFMFTCMLLIQTVSLVNSSSLLKWD